MRDCLFTNQKEQIEFFNREIRTLWKILIVFNSSYLLRGIWDQMSSPYMPEYYMMMLNIATGLAFDCFPVSCLIYFHYRNFKTKNSAKKTKKSSRAADKKSFRNQNEVNDEIVETRSPMAKSTHVYVSDTNSINMVTM